MSITDHPHNTGSNESRAIIVPPSRSAERCRRGFLPHVASSIAPSPFSQRTSPSASPSPGVFLQTWPGRGESFPDKRQFIGRAEVILKFRRASRRPRKRRDPVATPTRPPSLLFLFTTRNDESGGPKIPPDAGDRYTRERSDHPPPLLRAFLPTISRYPPGRT